MLFSLLLKELRIFLYFGKIFSVLYFEIVVKFTKFLIFKSRFPFYYEIKILFILWLILPQTQGATYLYNTFVDPTLTRHEKEIDSTLGMAQEKATNTGAEWGRYGLATLQELVADGIIKHIIHERHRHQREKL